MHSCSTLPCAADTRKLLLASTALLLTLGAAGPVLAQSQSMGSDAALEEIIVTGSSIRGVAPVGSQLIGVTQTSIQATAPANTKELLSNVPQLGNFGANAEQSTPGRWRTPGYQPNIHNLGMYATLTLVNGHRIAPTGGEAVLPDPSMIPVIAIQRVEIIADGASAVYGSDAVAGVVNFLYRRNVNGIEASGTFGFNGSRYRKWNGSVLAGHTWSTGSVMAAYEYSQNKSPLTSDISFLALGGDQTSRGGRDLRSANCLLPNVTVGGQVYGYQADGSFSTTRNLCGNLDPKSTIIPDGRRHALLVTARQELADNVEVWTELNYSRYDTFRWGGRPSISVVVPNTSPYFRLPDGIDPSTVDSIAVVRSGLGLFPSGEQQQNERFWAATVGADIRLGGDWVASAMAHVSKSNLLRDVQPPELNQPALAQLTADGLFNPFGQAADNSAAVLAEINNNYTQVNSGNQGLRELQIKADGPLFALPGGDVRMAAGVDFRVEQLNQYQTSGPLDSTGLLGPNRLIIRADHLSRTVTSAFTEINAPLFSEANARPFLQALTLSLSGRLDYYDKFGTIFNPKYGVNWSPIRDLTIRGSYSTSFVAPNMGMTTTSFSVPRPNSNINLTDVTTGEHIGIVNQLNPGGGNSDLQPEKATTWSAGADFVPDAIPGLRLSLSYYEAEYRNMVFQPSASDALTDPQMAMYRILHPTDAQLADFLAKYPAQSALPAGIVWDALIWYNAQNMGVRRVAGIDIDAAYSFDTQSLGSFNLGVVANLQTRFIQRQSPGAPFRDRRGTSDAPSAKIRYQLGWNLAPVTLNLFANHVSGYKYTSVNPAQEVDSNLTFDLSGALDLSNMIREGVSLQARVVNLFDKDPPFVDNSAGYYAALASPFGRQFELTVRAKF